MSSHRRQRYPRQAILDGRLVLEAPGPVKPYAYVVKCAGGCGADMLVPIEVTHPDGSVEQKDPDTKMWCLPCGATKFMNLDVGPGYGERKGE